MEAAFEENDNKVAVFLVDEGDLEKQITQELVNELGFAVYYLHYETAEGKTVYYLFNND